MMTRGGLKAVVPAVELPRVTRHQLTFAGREAKFEIGHTVGLSILGLLAFVLSAEYSGYEFVLAKKDRVSWTKTGCGVRKVAMGGLKAVPAVELNEVLQRQVCADTRLRLDIERANQLPDSFVYFCMPTKIEKQGLVQKCFPAATWRSCSQGAQLMLAESSPSFFTRMWLPGRQRLQETPNWEWLRKLNVYNLMKKGRPYS